jgi:hypothetical protein
LTACGRAVIGVAWASSSIAAMAANTKEEGY